MMEFAGEPGQNTTGAAVGGFEISSSSYLAAGHSVKQDSRFLNRRTRNVFVAAADKATSRVSVNWLTSYEEGDGTTSTPRCHLSLRQRVCSSLVGRSIFIIRK